MNMPGGWGGGVARGVSAGEREVGQGGAGLGSRPLPAVTTASSKPSRTQSGGGERMK